MKNSSYRINFSTLSVLSIAAILTLIFSACSSRIDPGRMESGKSESFIPSATAAASIESVNDWYEAVGTVRPRTETSIEAQITAQVLSVKVTPGKSVSRGQLLVLLDSRQLQSKLDQARQAMKTAIAGKEQARQAIVGAEAGFRQAEANYKRTKNYYDAQAATASDLEKAESAFLQAQAAVKRASEGLSAAESRILQAEEVVKESRIAIGYTQIKAPEEGVVLKRYAEPGDLALPGKPLITLRTAGSLRLEAFVREGLISQVQPGQQLKVSIETLGKTVDAAVEEVVPYADPQSRTFLVKSSLPQIEGLFPGMFGKLLIPVSQLEVVVVPKAAVRNVGQLELVYVKESDGWHSRYVKTGNTREDRVEILSGLNGTETIGWKEQQNV